MKLLPLHKAPMFLLGFIILVFVIISCSDDEDRIQVSWTYIGLRQVEVDSIAAPDTIPSIDTLKVYMSGNVLDVDLPLFSHVEETRNVSQADLKLWARGYAWSGSGPMPPTSYTVDCTHTLLPPFYPDTFVVHVHRPDNSVIQKAIHVID